LSSRPESVLDVFCPGAASREIDRGTIDRHESYPSHGVGREIAVNVREVA
jgi:hypothetical protein